MNERYRIEPPDQGTQGEWLLVDTHEGDREMATFPHDQEAAANYFAATLNLGYPPPPPHMVLGADVYISRPDGKFLRPIEGTGRAEWQDVPYVWKDPAAAERFVAFYAHLGAFWKEV
jgi:hypothetical protein